MTLGEFLKNKRIEKKLTQTELAEKLNLKSYQIIQNYEKNLSEPSNKNIFKLIDILNLDIEELKNILYQD